MNRVIETERLILRPWQKTDADINAIVAGFSDFDTIKMLTIPFPYTKEDALTFIDERENDDENSYYFAITIKESGKVIGGTTLSINRENNTNSGGIWLDKNYQGFGYGTEAWTARANFAFFELGLDRLYNGYFEFNEVSPKMQQKIGYKIVGSQERFCPALGGLVKEIRTVLTREDFISKMGLKIKK